jgi:hypothetical protein
VISTKFFKEKPRRPMCENLISLVDPPDFLDPQHLLHLRAGLRERGVAQRLVLGSGVRGPRARN